ncbi:MAG: hypothetical protein MMC33_005525 [Icmadophila ericetorum]|nr:hypothetical protein [Icmadophila ericetorum]
MEPVAVAPPMSDMELIELVRNGRAIFSTQNGRYERREARPFESSIILRSDPLDDVEAMTERLRKQYPQECQAITTPIHNIYEYFDHYDVQVHGTCIIHAVLIKIAMQNVSTASYAQMLQGFVTKWIDVNFDSFVKEKFEIEQLFSPDDRDQHGEDFLQDALGHIRSMRKNMPPQHSKNFQGITNPLHVQVRANVSLATEIEISISVPSISISGEIANPTIDHRQQVPTTVAQQSSLLPTEHYVPGLSLAETPVRCGSAHFVSPADSTPKSLPFDYGSEPDLELTGSSPTLSRAQKEDAKSNLVRKYSTTVVKERADGEQSLSKKRFPIPQRLPTIKEDAPKLALKSVSKPVSDNSNFDKPEWRRPRGPSLLHPSCATITELKLGVELEPKLNNSTLESRLGQKREMKIDSMAESGPPESSTRSGVMPNEMPVIIPAEAQQQHRQAVAEPQHPRRVQYNKRSKAHQPSYRTMLPLPYPPAEVLQTLPNGNFPAMPFQHQALQSTRPHTQNGSPHPPANVNTPTQNPHQRFSGPIMAGGYSPQMPQYNSRGELLLPKDGDTPNHRKVTFGMASWEMYGGSQLAHFLEAPFSHELPSPPMVGPSPYANFSNDARNLGFQNTRQLRRPLDERPGLIDQRENSYGRGNGRGRRRNSGFDRSEFVQSQRHAEHIDYGPGAGSSAGFFGHNRSSGNQLDLVSNLYNNQPHVKSTFVTTPSMAPAHLYGKLGVLPYDGAAFGVQEQNDFSSQMHKGIPLTASDVAQDSQRDTSMPPRSTGNGSATFTMPAGQIIMSPRSSHNKMDFTTEFCDDKLYIGGPGLTQKDIHDILKQYKSEFEIAGPLYPKRPRADSTDNFRIVFVKFDSPKDAYDVKEALTGRYFGSDGLQLTVEFARKKPLTYAHHPHVAANNGRPNFGHYNHENQLYPQRAYNNDGGNNDYSHHPDFRSTQYYGGAAKRDRAYSKNSSVNYPSPSPSVNIFSRENYVGRPRRPSEARHLGLSAGDENMSPALAPHHTDQQGQKTPRKGKPKKNQHESIGLQESTRDYALQRAGVSNGSPTKKPRKQGQSLNQPTVESSKGMGMNNDTLGQATTPLEGERQSVSHTQKLNPVRREHTERRDIQREDNCRAKDNELLISSKEVFPPLPSVSLGADISPEVTLDSKGEPKTKTENSMPPLQSQSAYLMADGQNPSSAATDIHQGSASCSPTGPSEAWAEEAERFDDANHDRPAAANESYDQLQHSSPQSIDLDKESSAVYPVGDRRSVEGRNMRTWSSSNVSENTSHHIQTNRSYSAVARATTVEDHPLPNGGDLKKLPNIQTEFSPIVSPSEEISDAAETPTTFLNDRRLFDIGQGSSRDLKTELKSISGAFLGNGHPEIPARTSALLASSPPKVSPPIATHRKRQKGKSPTQINFGSDSKLSKKKSDQTMRPELQKRSYPSADGNHAVEIFSAPSSPHENFPSRKSQPIITYGGAPQPPRPGLTFLLYGKQDKVDETPPEPENKKKSKKPNGRNNNSQGSATLVDALMDITNNNSPAVDNVDSEDTTSSWADPRVVWFPVKPLGPQPMDEKTKMVQIKKFLDEKVQQGWSTGQIQEAKEAPKSKKPAHKKKLEELHPELCGPRITEVEDEEVPSIPKIRQHRNSVSTDTTTDKEDRTKYLRSLVIDLENGPSIPDDQIQPSTLDAKSRSNPERVTLTQTMQYLTSEPYLTPQRRLNNVSDCSTITSNGKIHLEAPVASTPGSVEKETDLESIPISSVRPTAMSSQNKPLGDQELQPGLGPISCPPFERNSSPSSKSSNQLESFSDRTLPSRRSKQRNHGKPKDEQEFPPLNAPGGTTSAGTKKRKFLHEAPITPDSSVTPNQNFESSCVLGMNVSGKLTAVPLALTILLLA